MDSADEPISCVLLDAASVNNGANVEIVYGKED